LDGLATCLKVRHVEITNNLLGINYDGIEAPAHKLSELLISQRTIEHIDLSFNFIEPNSAFCIGFGLKYTESLKHLSL
jgi:hypothetical protein